MRIEPDPALAKRFIADSTIPGRVLLGSITGSHHYGFPSPDSDLDIKALHLAPTRALLGLTSPRDAFDRLEMFEDTECDLTSNEARQALGLLLRGNGNMLERILSPYQLFDSEDVQALQLLAREAVSKRFYAHYSGYLRGMIREYEAASAPTAKKALYAYRVALTGTHLLRTGQLQADLSVLAEPYGFSEALALITKKRATAERVTLDDVEDESCRLAFPRLKGVLDDALAESPLPDTAPNEKACEDWLITVRKRELEAH